MKISELPPEEQEAIRAIVARLFSAFVVDSETGHPLLFEQAKDWAKQLLSGTTQFEGFGTATLLVSYQFITNEFSLRTVSIEGPAKGPHRHADQIALSHSSCYEDFPEVVRVNARLARLNRVSATVTGEGPS